MKNFKLIIQIVFFTLFFTENIYSDSWHDGNYSNFGFTSYRLMNQFTGKIPVRTGSNIIATDIHVYYIGTNHKVCEYVWNGSNWQNGIQLEWTANTVQNNTQICNNGNELFFIRKSDNQICRLYFSAGWRIDVITTIPARAGTDLVYNDNVLYYVANTFTAATTNKVCFVSRPNSTSLFNLNTTLGSPASFDVLINSQIIYVGPTQSTTAAHLYYIGNNNRPYDIVNLSGTWTSSSNYLGAYSIVLPKIRPNSQLTNNENQLFYVGTDNMIYEMHWVSGPGWIGGLLNSTAQMVFDPSPIKYFDNHVYYIGFNNSRLNDVAFDGTSWCCTATLGKDPVMYDSKFTVYKGTTGHVIFTIGTDNYVKITLWDKKVCDFENGLDYCSDPVCEGSTWHNGGLNTTSHEIGSKSNIACGPDPANPNGNFKNFFYADMSGYTNNFLRSVNNDVLRIPWPITFDDEFNSLTTTQSLWDSQGPWAHGHAMPSNANAILWTNRAYATTDWSNNWSQNNGIGVITNKQEYLQAGHTWGWGTGDDAHPGTFCGDVAYDYTNALLCTGGINLDYDCADPWIDPDASYCQCGLETATKCEYDRIVNTCDNYVPRYTSGNNCFPPMSLPKFQQKYGWFEIRCKVPAGKNMWSAFWALNKGSGHSEIDFFEVDGDGKTMLSNVYYYDCQNNVPAGLHFKTYAVGYRFYDDFYTYACEWGPNYIRYYVNNELIGETNEPGALMQKDEIFLLVNAYVMDGTGRCGGPNFPNNYEIDYVRVYQNPSWQRLSQNIESNNSEFNSISVYPSAVSDVVHVKSSSENADMVQIEIINAMGERVMHTKTSFDTNSETEIDMSSLIAGMYFIKVTSSAGEKTYKVTKL